MTTDKKGNSMKIKSRMVNDVPMATIYKGMDLERFTRLDDLYNESFFATMQATDAPIYSAEFADVHSHKFTALMERNAVKAGWYASKRNKKNLNKKKKETTNV